MEESNIAPTIKEGDKKREDNSVIALCRVENICHIIQRKAEGKYEENSWGLLS